MKLILEGWRKFMKEEKVDPRMKKYLDDNPYMEANGLQEKKWEDFGIDKGEWREFSPSEIESSRDPVNVDVAEELFALIDNAYKDIGGNFDFQNPADLPGNSDYWAAIKSAKENLSVSSLLLRGMMAAEQALKPIKTKLLSF